MRWLGLGITLGITHEGPLFRRVPRYGRSFRGCSVCPFAVIMPVQFLMVLTLYPESNGVSLEKMEQRL
jgi:hypothetical protein